MDEKTKKINKDGLWIIYLRKNFGEVMVLTHATVKSKSEVYQVFDKTVLSKELSM